MKSIRPELHDASTPFPGSLTRYYPFGDYRNSTGHTVTDRGYTGHRHNDDLGLIYMNARYYLPGTGRFAMMPGGMGCYETTSTRLQFSWRAVLQVEIL